MAEESAAAWVAANLAAVAEAIEDAHAGPLTVASLCSWHRTLMTGSPTPAQHVGLLRTEHGTGDLEIALRSLDDLERAKPLIVASYEAS